MSKPSQVLKCIFLFYFPHSRQLANSCTLFRSQQLYATRVLFWFGFWFFGFFSHWLNSLPQQLLHIFNTPSVPSTAGSQAVEVTGKAKWPQPIKTQHGDHRGTVHFFFSCRLHWLSAFKENLSRPALPMIPASLFRRHLLFSRFWGTSLLHLEHPEQPQANTCWLGVPESHRDQAKTTYNFIGN